MLELNRHAAAMLRCPHRLMVVDGAGHLFEEPRHARDGRRLAAEWFDAHLGLARRRRWRRPGGLSVSATLALPLGERAVLEALRREAHPLTGDRRDYDALLALIGDARIVLLGEASHGTHEFYRERARITKRLIAEHGFTAVAIEGDWPDAYRVNRYVQGARDDPDAEEALGGFRRFPTWMWRNADVLDFVGWLRAHNDAPAPQRAPGRLLRPRPLQPRAPRWRR